jgi:hypothetical protein
MEVIVMEQLIQIVGALLILAAFILAQLGRLNPHSRSYLVANLAGSAILSVDAWIGEEWGFFLLESVWALVSAYGLAQVLRGRPPAAAH